VTLQDQGTVSIYPFVWAPGHSYTVTITGTYPTGFGAPTYCLGLSAWQWPDYPDYYQVGGYDSNIQISNPTWVSPTVTTFDVSVNSNAPTGNVFLELQVPGGEDFWGILIQPPPAPTQPSPPPPAPCATPALDPTNPVTPDTWIPGNTYNITVKGTGFTTQAASSLPHCPATTITVGANTGTIELSNIVVVDSTTITATVTPADTDPGELVTLYLWGPPEFDDDDDDQTPVSAAPPSGAPATVLLQDAPSTTLFVSSVLPQSFAWQSPAAFSSLLQPPAPQTTTLMAAVSQPLAPRAALAAAGVQNNSTPAGPSGMDLAGQTNLQLFKPYVIDPYLAPFNGSTYITESQVISKLWPASSYSRVQAQGMITDGSATAIVVAQLGKNKQVTFTGTDGIQFESWNPSFLSYPPSYGNCAGSCSIAVNPIQGGDGNYYAFALVLAPQQTQNTNYGFLVAQVTASVQTPSGVAQSSPTKLSIVPTPVIFVHGVWADLTTFNEMRTTLSFAEPWQDFIYNYNVLTQVCYDATVPFDFDGQPPANPFTKPNCSKASSTAINTAINQIQKSLDKVNFAGGRVDIVAHSMGGLATRHYTTTASYNSQQNHARSRSEGLLHTVIAIDSPETGSPLASALLMPAIANATCALASLGTSGDYTCDYGPSSGVAALTWAELCLFPNANVTLSQCLAGSPLKRPIGPGTNATNIDSCAASPSGCGAIASLALGSPNIAVLPRIDAIRSDYTKWFAIESDWKDNGGVGQSTLRALFDYLLGAMKLHSSLPNGICPQSQNGLLSLPPTLLCLMQNDPDNDVIVPTSSQADDTNGNLVEFFNDAHSSVGPGVVLSQLWGKSDANILDGRADSCVAQILLTSTIQGCPSAPSPAATSQSELFAAQGNGKFLPAPGESAEDAADRAVHPLQVGTRQAQLLAPAGDVPLGNSIRLRLNLSPGKVSTILYREIGEYGGIDTADSAVAKVVEDSGADKTIEVIPLQLGDLTVSVTVVYADNSTAEQSAKLNVVPTATGMTQFAVDQGFHDVDLILDENEAHRTHWLVPTVIYKSVKYPIQLNNSEQLSFTIDQSTNNPVIELDRDGRIKALRVGVATITAQFAGARDQIRVNVESGQLTTP
jgi:pimeloyl-ACP methyl ester carboxylesterase